jgi:hypothetical protein
MQFYGSDSTSSSGSDTDSSTAATVQSFFQHFYSNSLSTLVYYMYVTLLRCSLSLVASRVKSAHAW